jgi:hypothetical protein
LVLFKRILLIEKQPLLFLLCTIVCMNRANPPEIERLAHSSVLKCSNHGDRRKRIFPVEIPSPHTLLTLYCQYMTRVEKEQCNNGCAELFVFPRFRENGRSSLTRLHMQQWSWSSLASWNLWLGTTTCEGWTFASRSGGRRDAVSAPTIWIASTRRRDSLPEPAEAIIHSPTQTTHNSSSTTCSLCCSTAARYS